MNKFRKISYFLLLFSIVLMACGRQDKKDSERLEEMNAAVKSLYNVERNDLAEGLTVEHFEEVEAEILAENREDLSEENTERFNEIESLFENAGKMYELEESIHQLFVEDGREIIKEKVKGEEVERLFTSLAEIDSDQWVKYYEKQEAKLIVAEEQVEQIQLARDLVAYLYLEDNQVNPEASREEEKQAKEAVAQIKNETVQSKLDQKLEQIAVYLTEKEEAERAAKSIGDFAGYYHDATDNFLIHITEDRCEGFVPHSDVFFDYEIVEIIHNSGDEITLILHHEKTDTGGFYAPQTTTEVNWELIDDGAFLKSESSIIRRVTETEFDELKNPFD